MRSVKAARTRLRKTQARAARGDASEHDVERAVASADRALAKARDSKRTFDLVYAGPVELVEWIDQVGVGWYSEFGCAGLDLGVLVDEHRRLEVAGLLKRRPFSQPTEPSVNDGWWSPEDLRQRWANILADS